MDNNAKWTVRSNGQVMSNRQSGQIYIQFKIVRKVSPDLILIDFRSCYRQRIRQGCIWFILPTIIINNIPEQRDRYVFTLADFPWASLIIYADHPWMRIQWINNKNIKNLLIHWKCTSLGLDEALYHLYNLSLFCIL